MVPLKSISKVDLDKQLSRLDISVPPRNESRKSEHVERWSICRLLATLNKYKQLQFPIEVEKRERPDYFINQKGHHWGVEITEAIPESYARATAQLRPGDLLDISLFKYNDTKNRKEIREIISSPELLGNGWVGDAAEEELADAISGVVSKKIKLLNDEGFDTFPTNSLLIYENMPLPMFNLERATEYISQSLSSLWSKSYDDVYVESGNTFLYFKKNYFNTLHIPELWTDTGKTLLKKQKNIKRFGLS